MAKIEIDENEYAELKRVSQVASLIGTNPKAREMLQQAVAIAAPDQAGPEIRIRQEVQEKLSGLEKMMTEFVDGQKKEREERAAEAAKRELERRWMEGRGKLRDAGYNDEGLTKVEELMEKRGIADHEAAMALFERENPPAEPVSTGSNHWNFFDRATRESVDFKPLLEGDTDGFLDTAIPAALKEARGR